MRKRIKNNNPSSKDLLTKLKQFFILVLMKSIRPRFIVLYATIIFIVYNISVFNLAYRELESKWYDFLSKHDLVVKSIYLEGQNYTDEKDIISAIQTNIGDSIFEIDIVAIKQRLELLPWIKTASVERQLPSALMIRIVERVPMFLWQKEGKLYVVDSSGTTIGRENVDSFSDLIILIGEDAPNFAPDLLSIVSKDKSLFPLISSIIRIGNRRWDIRLYNDVEIKLPEHKVVEAWQKLSDMNQENKALLNNVKIVDLRLMPEKIFIK